MTTSYIWNLLLAAFQINRTAASLAAFEFCRWPVQSGPRDDMYELGGKQGVQLADNTPQSRWTIYISIIRQLANKKKATKKEKKIRLGGLIADPELSYLGTGKEI